MFLKTLKIIPLLTGVTSTPILNTPKKANEPQYQQEFSLDLEFNEHYKEYMENDFGDETPIIRETKQYVSTQYTSHANLVFNFKFTTEDYYANQNGENYILQNYMGNRQCHSRALLTLWISNVVGVNKIDLDYFYNIVGSMLPTHWVGAYPQMKFTTSTYVSTNDLATQYYNITIDSSSLYYMVNELKGDYHCQKIKTQNRTETMKNNTNVNLEYIGTNNQYEVNQNVSDWYFFMILIEGTGTYTDERENVYKVRYTNLESESLANVIIPYVEDGENIGPIIILDTYTFQTIQEIVDIPNLMFTVLTMPFAFYSQAFNLTLFPGTKYSFNIGNFLLCLLAVLIFAWVMKLIIGFIRK